MELVKYQRCFNFTSSFISLMKKHINIKKLLNYIESMCKIHKYPVIIFCVSKYLIFLFFLIFFFKIPYIFKNTCFLKYPMQIF